MILTAHKTFQLLAKDFPGSKLSALQTKPKELQYCVSEKEETGGVLCLPVALAFRRLKKED
jgi:hypothetical protein